MAIRRQTQPPTNPTTIIAILSALILVTIVLAITIRLQRGLLGLLLGALAVGLTIYWLRHIYTAVSRERSLFSALKAEPWRPDIIDVGDELLVVGKIQPPKDKINVQVREKTLEVVSGSDFRVRVTLPAEAETSNMSYRNGVLEIRLRKTTLQHRSQT